MELDFSLTPVIIGILFSTGLVAGFVDSIAGGGGLIALPVLLAVGLPPQVALGTNKLQGSFGTLSSSYNYIKKGGFVCNPACLVYYSHLSGRLRVLGLFR